MTYTGRKEHWDRQ